MPPATSLCLVEAVCRLLRHSCDSLHHARATKKLRLSASKTLGYATRTQTSCQGCRCKSGNFSLVAACLLHVQCGDGGNRLRACEAIKQPRID